MPCGASSREASGSFIATMTQFVSWPVLCTKPVGKTGLVINTALPAAVDNREEGGRSHSFQHSAILSLQEHFLSAPCVWPAVCCPLALQTLSDDLASSACPVSLWGDPAQKQQVNNEARMDHGLVQNLEGGRKSLELAGGVLSEAPWTNGFVEAPPSVSPGLNHLFPGDLRNPGKM